jgi:hypothetical protein
VRFQAEKTGGKMLVSSERYQIVKMPIERTSLKCEEDMVELLMAVKLNTGN